MNITCKPVIAAGLMSLSAVSTVSAALASYNSGSLGSVADGTNIGAVTEGQASPLAAAGDTSNGFTGGARTQIPFLAALNPGAASPFTIEFWANPATSDNDDAVVSNRFAPPGLNRSGWTFFQRAAGWNFRMYNGSGGSVGWDLTGGTSILNAWSHVVVTWDGSAAQLFVNGALADSTNDTASTPVYNPNIAANSPSLNVGANFDGGSPYNGLVDEVAWYPAALSSSQISNHFSLAASAVPGDYSNAVLGDGAALYLQSIPEPAVPGLATLAGLAVLARRRRA